MDFTPGVRMGPGAIAFTVILYGASSAARHLVNPIIPALAAP